MIQDELRKARRALKTAKVDLDAQDGAASVNRSYYAMYYAARAALLHEGENIPKTHSSLIGVFSKYFVEPGTFPKQIGRDFNKIEEQRRYVDYIANEEIPLDIAAEVLHKASAFVAEVDSYINPKQGPNPAGSNKNL